MKILYVSNFATKKCGVAEFGRQNVKGLREVGATVTEWVGDYPEIYARNARGEPSYLPENAFNGSYDVIHFNWHPVTLNHYVPSHLYGGPIISVYYHDIPPWSSCPIDPCADVKFSLEPWEDAVVIPPPAVDYMPTSPISLEPSVGRSAIGIYGQAELTEICARRGWTFSDSVEWLPIEEEVERLAKCWVNVVWYDHDRSRSSSAMVCAAARRPLLLSRCSRFAHLWPYEDELYIGELHQLEEMLDGIIWDVEDGEARRPGRLLAEFGWRRTSERMIEAWEAAR